MLRLFYQWVHKDNSRKDGLYELDYPEHLLAFSGHWNFLPNWRVFAIQTLRYQTQNEIRTSGDFGADASVGFYWNPQFARRVRFSMSVDNLWNSDFQQIAGLKPRPISVMSGVLVRW